LLLLSIATSIDAFVVGLSFFTLGLSILGPAALIGIVALVLTALGASFGPAIGRMMGRRAEFLGGLILIVNGIKILFDHL